MTYLLSFLLMLLLLMASPRQRILVDYPVIEGRASQDYFEIYQLERTDTALLLRGNVYHRPRYWVQLDTAWLVGRTTGKRYRFVRSWDLPMSKKVGMPESGTREVTLQFELPDPADKVVDYYEADGELSFRGIHLYPAKQKGFCCVIRGTVCDSVPCSRLVLVPWGSDLRIQPFISVPVREGKFEYPLYTTERTVYTLLSWHDHRQGGWRPVDFWVEPGMVELRYAPAAAKKRQTVIVPHTPANQEMLRFARERDSVYDLAKLWEQSWQLHKEDRYYTPKMKEWIKVMEKSRINRDSMYKVREQMELANEMYTPEAAAVMRKIDKQKEKRGLYELEYAAAKPSLNGLYILVRKLKEVVQQGKKQETDRILQLYREKYQKKFAGHPLAVEAGRFIGALEIRKGGHFIDFTAPDLEGNRVTLSEYICGKVALIDLWASWCGGCRTSSRSMIPVYEEFKDKGFTIVGIARESGDTKAMKEAIRKDGYPWLNLVELNDRGAVWYKYGVGNAGGTTVLVDQQGMILAVQPTAAEVRQILKELLGEK